MSWTVLLDTAFEREFAVLPEAVQDELLAHAKLLGIFGPQLGRPRVDTLKGSKHANMKELRFDAAGGVRRVAFAFDPKRRAILLVAGDKAGRGERRFYKQLIEKADKRFDIPVAREYFGKRGVLVVPESLARRGGIARPYCDESQHGYRVRAACIRRIGAPRSRRGRRR